MRTSSNTLSSSVVLPGRPVASETLAEFTSYAEAQQTVDRLSDAGYAVEHLRIVGTGIHSVEQVTGRVTTGRAALAGTGMGAWFGLLIGLLVGIFAPGVAWLGVLFGSVVIGAVWGTVFGFAAQWATRGTRDFSSISALQAQHYSVQVDSSDAVEARRVMTAV